MELLRNLVSLPLAFLSIPPFLRGCSTSMNFPHPEFFPEYVKNNVENQCFLPFSLCMTTSNCFDWNNFMGLKFSGLIKICDERDVLSVNLALQ